MADDRLVREWLDKADEELAFARANFWEARFRWIKRKLAEKAKAAGIITEEDVFSRYGTVQR